MMFGEKIASCGDNSLERFFMSAASNFGVGGKSLSLTYLPRPARGRRGRGTNRIKGK